MVCISYGVHIYRLLFYMCKSLLTPCSFDRRLPSCAYDEFVCRVLYVYASFDDVYFRVHMIYTYIRGVLSYVDGSLLT